MSSKLCKLLLDVDEYFNDGTVDEDKFNKNKSLQSKCPQKGQENKCTTNNERINALGEYLYQKLPKDSNEFKGIGNNDNLHIEFFMMWLGDKIYKVDKDYKSTLEESYEKYLKNITGNFEYWDALNSKKVYKNATVVRMYIFYNLLNSICKTINELEKNLNNTDAVSLKKYGTQCLDLYRNIYESVKECKSYTHLLDSLKTIYEYIKSYKITNNNSIEDSKKVLLFASTPSLTTSDYKNAYFIPNDEILSFSNQECEKLKLKDEKDGEKGPSTDLQSTQGIGQNKKPNTRNQAKPTLSAAVLRQLQANRQRLKAQKKPQPQPRPRPQPPPAPTNPAHRSQQGQQPPVSSGISTPSPDTTKLGTPPSGTLPSGTPKSSDATKSGTILPLGMPSPGATPLGASTPTITTDTTSGTSTATSICTTAPTGAVTSTCTTPSPGIQNGVVNIPKDPNGGTSSQQTNQDAKQVNQNGDSGVKNGVKGDQGSSGSQGGGTGGSPVATDTNKGGTSGVAGGGKGSQLGDPSGGTRDPVSGAGSSSSGGLGIGQGGAATTKGDPGVGGGSGLGSTVNGTGTPSGGTRDAGSGATSNQGKASGVAGGGASGDKGKPSGVAGGGGNGDQRKPSDMSGSPVNVQGSSNDRTGDSGGGPGSGAGGTGGIAGDGKVDSSGGIGDQKNTGGQLGAGGNSGDTGTDQGNSGGGAIGGSGGSQGAQHPASVDTNNVPGSSGGGSKASGDPDPTHSSGTSNGYWPSLWGASLNPMSYIPSASEIYESQKNILTNAGNKISNAYSTAVNIAKDAYGSTVSAVKNTYNSAVTAVKNTYNSAVTNINYAYDTSTNYIGGVVNSVASQLNPFGASTSGDNQSGPGGAGSGSSTGSSPLNPPQIPNSDPNPPPLPSSPPVTTPSPSPTSPSTQPTISQPQSGTTQGSSQITDQNGGPDPVQSHDTNPGTGIPKTLTNSSTDPSTQGNVSTTGIVVKINEKPSIWCIAPNKKCDLVGISVIGVSISIFLAIMYKYLSFGSAKNSKKGKNMKRVINSTSGKKQIQIVIKSYSQKKQTKKSIKSVYREKSPLLNIYKLMQADPMP
ncbi:CIR protein, partial [Plasmodium chabaudi chabaudi]